MPNAQRLPGCLLDDDHVQRPGGFHSLTGTQEVAAATSPYNSTKNPERQNSIGHPVVAGLRTRRPDTNNFALVNLVATG
eukprot:CAMPEP_0204368174 /NCGR_PEP_ID=MMETSP0469-20131031/43990_1 /ASSEMBLY_ACC=CAM_ASM_000384 /TAXON_ID=2969 /ORGANISM="Oxyrrhis marina" /LENGTH=78 /DNA_ID=CAMNT_0051357695 /DNA_START=30 /DNA_END=263 /DNA_ORIENTATION=+